jgi:LPXTG-motif cell wall-anchored protein
MRRSAVTPEPPPPPTQPPATDPVVIDGPATVVPAAPAPARASSPAGVAPVQTTASAAPQQLPATGTTVDTTMLIGAIVLALGSGLSLLARRQSTAG